MSDAVADPASLERLHDIVAPSPVSLWWPPAPGWWILFGIVALGVIWLAVRWVKARRADAYRREALRELAQLEDARRLPELLKRTALAAYPRKTVASLTGDRWLAFLNESAPGVRFHARIGETLKKLQYSPADVQGEKRELIQTVREWIKGHQNAGRLGSWED